MFIQVTSSLPYLLLCLDVLLGLLAICSMIGNGFILILIVSRPSLRKNESIYLITALSFADFLLAATVLPYVILLISEWDVNLNYSALKVIVFALPIVVEIKINSILTVAIAFDRFTAIQWPVQYKMRKKSRYVVACFLIGVLWATFDVAFLFSTTAFEPRTRCAAAGCFMSDLFRYYWGESNMCINLVAMATTVLVLIEIRRIYKVQAAAAASRVVSVIYSIFSSMILLVGLKSQSQANSVLPVNSPLGDSDTEKDKFRYANRVAVSVLLCSGCCILLPSIFAGVGEMLGLPAFQTAGPFVEIGLVLCGFINSFIYAQKHKDIRHAIKVLGKGTVSVSRANSNVGLPMTVCQTAGRENVVVEPPPFDDSLPPRIVHRTSIISHFVNELEL